MATAIAISELVKTFGATRALDGLNLEVAEGQVHGFLGPNGAGKSTTLFMLLGLVRPTSGKVRLFGKEGGALREARRHVGALIETAAFYTYLSGQKNLEILARIQGLPADPHIPRVLERVGLLPYRNQRVGTYSHGMRQRLGIAQALLGGPRLLVLDEPTNGLDPEGSHEVWALLRNLVNDGAVTVFISSHLLSEVEEYCDEAAIILNGKLIVKGPVTELLRSPNRPFIVGFENPPMTQQARDRLSKQNWCTVLDGQELGPQTFRVRLFEKTPSELNAFLVASNLPPDHLEPERRTLKEFFLETTGRRQSREER